MDLDSIVKISTFIANCAGVLTFIVALVAAIISYKAFNDSKKRKASENAVKLAQYFQRSLILQISSIKSLLKQSDYALQLKPIIDSKEIKSFSLNEMKQISGNDHIDLIFSKAIQSIPPDEIYKIFTTYITDDDCTHMIVNSVEKYQNGDNSALYIALYAKITAILNQIEWFSMNFKSNIANEQVVYQSLHQVFIEGVNLLYYFICSCNKNVHDKYYTSIIWLYGLWLKRRDDTKSKEQNASLLAEKKLEYTYEKVKK